MLKRLSPLLFGIALSASLLGAACRSAPESVASPPAISVKLATLQSTSVEESSDFVGNLEAVQIVQIRAEIQGRIEQISAQPGQEVAAGQPIMVLTPDQTVPQLQSAIAGVEEASGKRENAVKALATAKAQRETAKAVLMLDDLNVERARLLVNAGALGQIRLDEALTKQEASKNNLIAAEEQVAAAEVLVKQAEAAIRQSQAAVDASRVSVEFKTITAPIAGLLDDLPVKIGDYVSTGQVVAKVTQTDALFLNIEVPADRASQLRTGLTVELIDPTNTQQLAVGSLTFISPTANTESQAVLTKARFRNVEGKLRDGQYVQARIIWKTQSGILIPITAVSRVGGKNFVYRLDDQPSENGQMVVRLIPVGLGDIQGDSYQVTSGLEQGDRIAVSNVLKLRDGVPIQPES